VDELLSIGDFSTRCGLSAKMLRSYAAAGLLVPAAVDGCSGYRYYSGAQLQRARVIALLRRAGITVTEIAAFFGSPEVAQFDRWERDIEAELSSRRQALAEARAAFALDKARLEAPTGAPRRGCPMAHNFVAGSASHRGGRDTNQDAVLVSDDLFAVADGLGGLQDGEIASRLALEALHAAFGAARSRSGLISACREANQAVWEQATLDGDDPTMGATLAAVGIVADGEPVVVHVGDSRLYRYRDGQLDQLTDDHSITADLIRAGEITAREAQTHPQRNIVTRALGVAPNVEVDTSDVSCEPGDRLMLCTDGLYKALTTAQLEAALASRAEAQHVADELITMAVDRGAEDNATAVIIDIG
jgi:protein phosphatase